MTTRMKAPGSKPQRGAGKKAARRARPAGPGKRTVKPQPAPASRYELIVTAAYFRAEQRGFEPGHELEDWLAAEAEVERRLGRGDFVPMRPA